ncbi:hypothetical protein CH330_07485 [candidate division WOR-3 bacterium JGI_Cruoil_03_51_56]|uniref:Uncharacterized protein n=1 Tax=candidate division WOR-3 bacterium JGI_Cruoil_03_51_56 TaxID=1973747 RepID=A0A235BSX2_UNCW3|nr:MAG: hypothetical protein CH330_07485 [candidate division WOR-3 bacterium JGI_Cruoil_03_51_56]
MMGINLDCEVKLWFQLLASANQRLMQQSGFKSQTACIKEGCHCVAKPGYLVTWYLGSWAQRRPKDAAAQQILIRRIR